MGLLMFAMIRRLQKSPKIAHTSSNNYLYVKWTKFINFSINGNRSWVKHTVMCWMCLLNWCPWVSATDCVYYWNFNDLWSSFHFHFIFNLSCVAQIYDENDKHNSCRCNAYHVLNVVIYYDVVQRLGLYFHVFFRDTFDSSSLHAPCSMLTSIASCFAYPLCLQNNSQNVIKIKHTSAPNY